MLLLTHLIHLLPLSRTSLVSKTLINRFFGEASLWRPFLFKNGAGKTTVRSFQVCDLALVDPCNDQLQAAFVGVTTEIVFEFLRAFGGFECHLRCWDEFLGHDVLVDQIVIMFATDRGTLVREL